jgi:hypothetical protein
MTRARAATKVTGVTIWTFVEGTATKTHERPSARLALELLAILKEPAVAFDGTSCVGASGHTTTPDLARLTRAAVSAVATLRHARAFGGIVRPDTTCAVKGCVELAAPYQSKCAEALRGLCRACRDKAFTYRARCEGLSDEELIARIQPTAPRRGEPRSHA